MPGFGLYQTGRLLLRSGRETFWVAKDDNGRPCTLHVMELPDFWDDSQKSAATRDFLAAIDRQKTLAEDTAAVHGVAKVLATGTNENAAYAAMEPEADSTESLERVVSSRAQLSTGVLRQFTRQMLAKISALHKAGHAHGNLSAETILLTSGNLAKAESVLISPAPRARQDDDLPALGGILFQLIQHKVFSAQSGIDAEGTDWRQQEDGLAWKHLIASLLLPEPDATAESFVKTLPGGGRLPAWTKAAAALVLVALVAIVAVSWMGHRNVPPPNVPDWLKGATEAADTVTKEQLPAGAGKGSPAANLLDQLFAIAHEKTFTASSEATVKDILGVSQTPSPGLPAALDAITQQFKQQVPAGQEPAYPGYMKLVSAIQAQADAVKDLVKKGTNQSTFQVPFESVKQLAALSLRLDALSRELDTGPGPRPQVLQHTTLVVVDNDFKTHDIPSDDPLADILTTLTRQSQAYNTANDIVKQNSQVVWEAIKTDDYKPNFADLDKLDHDLSGFHKEDPALLTQQAGDIVKEVRTKLASLKDLLDSLHKDTAADPKIIAAADANRNAYQAVLDRLTSQFPTSAHPGDPFNKAAGIYWIRRDTDKIKSALAYNDRELQAKYDSLILDANWLPKFLADDLQHSYFDYYITQPAHILPKDPKAWSANDLSTQHALLPSEFQAVKHDYEDLTGRLQGQLSEQEKNIRQTPPGLEQSLYKIVQSRLAKIEDDVLARKLRYSPATDTARPSMESLLKYISNYNVTFKTLGGLIANQVFDLKSDSDSINGNLGKIKALDADPDFKNILAPAHSLAAALDKLGQAARSADPKIFDDSTTLFSNITWDTKWNPTPHNPSAFTATLWNSLAEIKNAKLDLLNYEWGLTLGQISPNADPKAKLAAASQYLESQKMPPDSIANILIAGVLPAILKQPDPTKPTAPIPSTFDLAATLETLNKANNPRLTSIVACLRDVPKATITAVATAGLPDADWKKAHGWSETTKQGDDVRIFTHGTGEDQITLNFKKLKDSSAYLCTTEASFKLLLALSSDEFSTLRSRIRLLGAGFPKLPGDVTANLPLPIQPGGKIFAESPQWGTASNADDSIVNHADKNQTIWFASSPPMLDEPVQAFTPAMAAYLAIKCGCRLPTKTDWDLADSINTAAAPDYAQKSHLGGAALKAYRDSYQAEFIVGAKADTAQFNPLNLTIGVFDPGTAAVSAALPATPKISDLLFRDTATDAANVPFKHLIGNVAEFIFDANISKPLTDDKTIPTALAAAALKSIDDLLKDPKNAPSVQVIGGSCLSLTTPADARKPHPVPDTSKPYTDVGLRLAFDASTTVIEPFAQHFKTLTSKQLAADDLVNKLQSN